MFKNDDVHDPEAAWDRNILSDLILAVRPYRVPEIGNAAAFWRGRTIWRTRLAGIGFIALWCAWGGLVEMATHDNTVVTLRRSQESALHSRGLRAVVLYRDGDYEWDASDDARCPSKFAHCQWFSGVNGRGRYVFGMIHSVMPVAST